VPVAGVQRVAALLALEHLLEPVELPPPRVLRLLGAAVATGHRREGKPETQAQQQARGARGASGDAGPAAARKKLRAACAATGGKSHDARAPGRWREGILAPVPAAGGIGATDRHDLGLLTGATGHPVIGPTQRWR